MEYVIYCDCWRSKNITRRIFCTLCNFNQKMSSKKEIKILSIRYSMVRPNMSHFAVEYRFPIPNQESYQEIMWKYDTANCVSFVLDQTFSYIRCVKSEKPSRQQQKDRFNFFRLITVP